MAAGDPVTKEDADQGVAMLEGEPGEPTGPEDAAGHGVKRGDYSDRKDHPDKPHAQMEADGPFDQKAAMETEPGVPEEGEKGGVTSAGGSEGEVPDEAGEEQTVTVDATSFTLTFDGETTGSLTVASTNGADVEAALEGLSNIDPGDVSVTGPDTGPYVVTFAGQYEGEDVPALTGTGTGGAASVVVT